MTTSRSTDLTDLIATPTDPDDYPLATTVIDRVVVYDAPTFHDAAADPNRSTTLRCEIERVLHEGPGVFFVRDAIAPGTLGPVSDAFTEIIDRERNEGRAAGDHFAKPGANNRVWNALEKLAVGYPDAFVDYYESDVIHLAALAWLGPGYQVTSQLNRVNPGGAAQSPHADYHLGFMSAEQSAGFPIRVHDVSRSLTLQGAVAHSDMSVASGPTMLLPHSQKHQRAYLDIGQPAAVELFAEHQVQIPMRAGDAMFFNPALMHAAGTNRTPDVLRLANLLQISSAFGRAMESVDREAVLRSIYPSLLARTGAGWSAGRIARVIAASAEGYAFPTNLDRDPPIGGLAPPTQADLVREALERRDPLESFRSALAECARRRCPN